MALFDDSQSSRTLAPTSRRRRQARERGMVARSFELLFSAKLLAVWAVLALWLPGFAASTRDLLQESFEHAVQPGQQSEAAIAQLRNIGLYVLTQIAIPFGLITAAILIAHFGQVGWMWRLENIAPQSTRLSPLLAVEQWFSMTTLARISGTAIKLALVVIITSRTLSHFWLNTTLPNGDLPANRLASNHTPSPSNSLTTDTLFASVNPATHLVSQIVLVWLVLGGLDFFLQRWRFERSLRMTPEEVRNELKEVEAAPQLRQQRESARRQLAQQPPHANDAPQITSAATV